MGCMNEPLMPLETEPTAVLLRNAAFTINGVTHTQPENELVMMQDINLKQGIIRFEREDGSICEAPAHSISFNPRPIGAWAKVRRRYTIQHCVGHFWQPCWVHPETYEVKGYFPGRGRLEKIDDELRAAGYTEGHVCDRCCGAVSIGARIVNY